MPTVLRIGRYRFFFYSNEREEPAHIHVQAGSAEAKFWLAPVELAATFGFSAREVGDIASLVREHEPELAEAWNEYFGN